MTVIAPPIFFCFINFIFGLQITQAKMNRSLNAFLSGSGVRGNPIILWKRTALYLVIKVLQIGWIFLAMSCTYGSVRRELICEILYMSYYHKLIWDN